MRTSDNISKRRLTEPRHILSAVTMLEARGVGRDELIVEMSKVFCVDLDEFDRVLRSRQPNAHAASGHEVPSKS